MKTNNFLLAFALMFALAVSSCTKEQSEFNLSDVSDSATIYGQVLYNQGIKVSGDTLYENYLVPVEGQEVYVKVDLSNYKTGAIGSERYSAITDEYGNYSITIPVGQTQINEDLEVTSFTGAYSQIVNGVTYSYDDAIYQNISTTSFLVGAGDQKVVNVTISDKPTFATESLDRSVDVYGEVYVAAESIGYDSTGAVESIVKTLDGLNDDVTIKVSHNSDSRQIYYTIGVSKGLFDETINFYDSWDFSDVIVTLMKTAKTVEEDDSSSEKFTHYYVLKNQTTRNIQYLTGTYSAISKSVSLSDSYMETLDYDMGTSEIYFTPSNISDVLGITDGSPDYECYNPMGW